MAKIIDATAQKYYVNCETKDWVFIDFYRAVCEVAEYVLIILIRSVDFILIINLNC